MIKGTTKELFWICKLGSVHQEDTVAQEQQGVAISFYVPHLKMMAVDLCGCTEDCM